MATLRFVKNPERIRAYLNDSEKKSILQVLKELFVLSFQKKEIPYYYFLHLYKKSVKNISDYLSTKERAMVRADIEKKHELISVMENKLNFAFYCEKYNLKSPKAIVHSFSSNFYYLGKIKKNTAATDLIDYFACVLEKESVNELFARPLSLLGGKGCFKLTKDNLETKLAEEKERLLAESYIFTRVVKQHPEINQIHKNSINTIRFLSFITNEGDIELISAAMRFGIGKSVVDNNSSGGFYIPVDLKNGTLASSGWTKTDFGGQKITHHPDSNFKLEGFKIPYYEEAYQLVLEYTKYIPNKLVGWDIAITPEGPTVIEANHNPYLGLSDIGAGGLLKNRKFKSYLNSLKENATK